MAADGVTDPRGLGTQPRDTAGKWVATFAVDGEVRFVTAADRAAFAEELATARPG